MLRNCYRKWEEIFGRETLAQFFLISKKYDLKHFLKNYVFTSFTDTIKNFT